MRFTMQGGHVIFCSLLRLGVCAAVATGAAARADDAPAPPATPAAPVTPAAPPQEAAAPTPAPAPAPAPPPVQIVAQDSTTAPVEAKPAAQLGEIVVTATKREESVRKIPSTVDVLKGKDLEDIGAREMEDFLKYIPGITLQEGDTNNSRTISIRGIGPQPGANTTVGTLIDDVSMGDPYASYLVPDLDPFDLHDLEVLKGPQGTLFGASALNGAIRYVLNKPELGNWAFKGFADWLHPQADGHGETYGGAVNIPLGSTIALRAVDVVQETPGLYDDVNANGKNIKDADNGYKRMHRFMGLWQPFDRLSINAFYLQQQGHKNDLSIANNTGGQFVRTDTPGPSTSSQAFSVENVDIRYNFDWFTVISESSHSTKTQTIDYDTSALLEPLATAGIASLRTYSFINSRSDAEEVRLVSAGNGPWVWLIGGYIDRYSADLTENIYVANTGVLGSILNTLGLIGQPGDLLNLLFPTPQGLSVEDIHYSPLTAREESVFGELTRKLFNDKLNLNIGGRAYREHMTGNVTLGGVTAPLGTLENYGGEKALQAGGFNPKASITLQATDNILWYATAAHGFQFGGFNEPAPLPTDNTFPLQYKPSTIWSYETGLRTDAFHKTLQLDGTVFLLNWKNLQLQQTTPDGVTTYTENVGAARSKGIETSIRYLTPIPGLIFVNVASYIHAKVAEPYTTSSGEFVPVGTDLPAAPRLQTATTLSYNTKIGSLRTGAGVTFTHEGAAFNDIEHDKVIFHFNTLDFNYNLSFPYVFMAPALTVNATNLLNTHSLVGAQLDHLGNSSDGEFGAFVRPRTIDLRISLKL